MTDTPKPYGDIREPEEERIAKSFRFLSSLAEKLAANAQKFGCSENYYVELALRNQFKHDDNNEDEQPKRKEPKKSP